MFYLKAVACVNFIPSLINDPETSWLKVIEENPKEMMVVGLVLATKNRIFNSSNRDYNEDVIVLIPD